MALNPEAQVDVARLFAGREFAEAVATHDLNQLAAGVASLDTWIDANASGWPEALDGTDCADLTDAQKGALFGLLVGRRTQVL